VTILLEWEGMEKQENSEASMVLYGLTSHTTHYRSFRRRFMGKSKRY